MPESIHQCSSMCRRDGCPFEDTCKFCGGTGETVIPAHQQAGEMEDEQIIKCKHCNPHANEENEDYGSDF